jgi:hypothetical protein
MVIRNRKGSKYSLSLEATIWGGPLNETAETEVLCQVWHKKDPSLNESNLFTCSGEISIWEKNSHVECKTIINQNWKLS